jgi:hypothetical protein
MSDELLNSTPETGVEAPVDDIRSVMAAAIKSQRGEETPIEKVPVAEAPKDDRAREADGRFKVAEKAAEKPVQAVPKVEGTQVAEPTAAPAHNPAQAPWSWSAPAKAEFANLPQTVRDAIAKRETEVAQGLSRMSDYKPLDQYVEMAKESGTTLHEALSKYTSIEDAFRKDPIVGLAEVCKNMGLSPRAIHQELGRRLGIQPGAPQQPGQQPQAPQLSPEYLDRLNRLENAFGTREQQFARQEEASRADAIQNFFSSPDHPYAENVADTMAQLITLDKSKRSLTEKLKSAYEQAIWVNPEVRDVLFKQGVASQSGSIPAKADAAARARQAAKATVGAPGNGVAPQASAPASQSTREALRAALESQRSRA